MKRLYSAIIVLTALCYSMTASAYVKQLLNETYSSAQTAAQTAWVSTWDPAFLSMIVDSEGKYIVFSPGSSGGDRSCYYPISSSIYNNVEEYEMTFNFNIRQFGNDDEHATEIVVLADGADPTVGGNIAGGSTPYIFSLKQNGAPQNGIYSFLLNGEESRIQLEPKVAYSVWLKIDAGGNVEYDIAPMADLENFIAHGTYSLGSTSYKATGLYCLAGRFNAQIYFYNFNITTDVDEPYANKPDIYLSGIDGTTRKVDVTFVVDGAKGHEEELFYTMPGEDEPLYDYDVVDDGHVQIQGITTSGILKAWTVVDGETTSEIAEFYIDCSPVQLVPATATVASVEAGYGKSYKISIDRTQIPLTPMAYLHVKFTPESAGTAIDKDIEMGDIVTVDAKGTLEVTATSKGYESSMAVIQNDVEYELTNDFDFMAYSEQQVQAFDGMVQDTKMTDDRWFNNWHWGEYHDTDGNPIYFGTDKPTPSVFYDETAGQWGTTRYLIGNTNAFAPLKLWNNTEVNRTTGTQNELKAYLAVHLGLWAPYEDETGTTYENTEEITIDGGYAEQFFVVEEIRYYGRSTHDPVVTVLRGNEGYKLYRFSSVIPRIRIYSPVGGNTGIQGVKDSDNVQTTVDAPIYNLSGVRVNKSSLPKGIYIQNGKKFVVK